MTIETLSQSQQPDSATVVDNRLDSLPMLIPVPRAAELLGISRSAAYRCAARRPADDAPRRPRLRHHRAAAGAA